MTGIERTALQKIRLHGSPWWRDKWGTPAKIANDALIAADAEYVDPGDQLRGAVEALRGNLKPLRVTASDDEHAEVFAMWDAWSRYHEAEVERLSATHQGAVEALRDLWDAIDELPESLPVERRAALAVRVLTILNAARGQ